MIHSTNIVLDMCDAPGKEQYIIEYNRQGVALVEHTENFYYLLGLSGSREAFFQNLFFVSLFRSHKEI